MFLTCQSHTLPISSDSRIFFFKWSKRGIIQNLIIKKLNISTSQKKKKKTHTHKYMKFYNFFLLTKWKGKKWLILIDKLKTNNVNMKIISWDYVLP